MSAVVVVPVYKGVITENEEISLRQCLDIFWSREICFVMPSGLHARYIPDGANVRRECFDPEFFKSAMAYNRLMLSIDFYRRFESHDFMLIYQLDAFVFSDQLDAWCEKGFDYIGAPWFSEEGMSAYAGNGGFSLRKIDAFIAILTNRRGRLHDLGQLMGRYSSLPRIIYHLPEIARRFLARENRAQGFAENPSFNEDHFFSAYGPRLSRTFKVAGPEASLAFSFEENPEELYILNGEKLPFGCHGFEKNSPEFWREFIPMEASQ